MTKDIDAPVRSYVLRNAEGQLRIANGDLGYNVVAEHNALLVSFSVSDDSTAVGFAPCGRRSGDSDYRHRPPHQRSLLNSIGIVPAAQAANSRNSDCLGCVHRAATAEGDYYVTALFPGQLCTPVARIVARIRFYLVIDY